MIARFDGSFSTFLGYMRSVQGSDENLASPPVLSSEFSGLGSRQQETT